MSESVGLMPCASPCVSTRLPSRHVQVCTKTSSRHAHVHACMPTRGSLCHLGWSPAPPDCEEDLKQACGRDLLPRRAPAPKDLYRITQRDLGRRCEPGGETWYSQSAAKGWGAHVRRWGSEESGGRRAEGGERREESGGRRAEGGEWKECSEVWRCGGVEVWRCGGVEE